MTMNYVPGFLRMLLLGAALAAAPNTAKAQQNEPSARLTLDYGKGERSAYLGYWTNMPRLRLGYADMNNFSFGSYIPFSRGIFKVAGSKSTGTEELGAYYQQTFGNTGLVGGAAEWLDDRAAGEAHIRFPAGRSNNIFAGYGNMNGTSITTIGDFLDLGNWHLGTLFSLKGDRIEESFGGRRQIMLYFARDNHAKFFYRNDGEMSSFTGFLRFGDEGLQRYTPRAFDNDRINFSEFTLRHSGAELFDIPLQPSNTHLSDQGTCASSVRITDTPEKDQQSVQAFCTHSGLIGGYGLSRTETSSGTNYEHTISAGANLGPAKAVVNWNSRNGFSVHASLRHGL